MEHPNAELYRRLTAAFQSGDIDTVKNALAPGVRWHEAGNPEVLGREAVLQQMSGAIRRIDGNIAVHDVLANDEHVIAISLLEASLLQHGHLLGSVVAEPISAQLYERLRRRGRIYDPVDRPAFDEHRAFGLPDGEITLLMCTEPTGATRHVDDDHVPRRGQTRERPLTNVAHESAFPRLDGVIKADPIPDLHARRP
jgi:hypothetical protein